MHVSRLLTNESPCAILSKTLSYPLTTNAHGDVQMVIHPANIVKGPVFIASTYSNSYVPSTGACPTWTTEPAPYMSIAANVF